MFDDARREAEKFRWIESEKVGYDLGDAAVRAWVARHWAGFVRARVLEHLTGSKFWIELDRGDFGALVRRFPNDAALVREIADQFAAGSDNLSIISWAMTANRPMQLVTDILQALDINARQLPYPFAEDDADPPHIVHG
jgi:hypothetical protein